MSNADLKVGDRVRLSPTTKWKKDYFNPLDILGTVSSFFLRSSLMWVNWDNGCTNRYYTNECDLILVESQIDDPSNITLSDVKW